VNGRCRPPDGAGSVLVPAVELELDGVVAVWLAGVVSEEPVAVDGLGLGELECVGVEDFD
jgi:hypothetical protein